MRPILYSFRRCPYAMRARLAIVTAGNGVDLREVVLRAKPAAMLAASAKGTVPVLVLADGTVIDESLDIMRWALARMGARAGWSDRDDPAAIATNDGAFKHHLDRYKYADRHDVDPRVHRDAATAILRGLDDRLHDATNLCGDAPGITDLAILPFVRQFAQVDRKWFDAQPLAALQAWLERHLSAPSFAAIMTRPRPWQPGDPPVPFGDDSAASAPMLHRDDG